MACVVKRRGRWVVDFRDHAGKRRWETYDTRKDADDALAKRIAEVKGNTFFAARDLPTFDAVAADWLAGMRDRAKSTVKFYSQQLGAHLLPAFGPVRVDRISSQAVEKFRQRRPVTQVSKLLGHKTRASRSPPTAIGSLMQRIRTARRWQTSLPP